ncbi:MAG: membrane dipeptidase [Candidatus Eisenbacteria bacterium]|nr:membrane dipeptidase [Candidatus Eisenbacteria bacterium]
MNETRGPVPVIDLHCDLLDYLEAIEGASPDDASEIGCALPRLAEGGVNLQVLAIFSHTGPGSVDFAEGELRRYRRILRERADSVESPEDAAAVEALLGSKKTGLTASIENASSLCGEEEPLEEAFRRFKRFRAEAGRILYISLTHHLENRFGGGNTSEAGLKGDGEVFLDYLSGKGVAVDFSHTSDALARDILDRIDSKGLAIPVLASHSNFRAVQDHPRNLPDDSAREIIRRGGVIGINLLRYFLGPDDPKALLRHVEHGLSLGAENALAFGADYYYTKNHPDRSRIPFYHPGQEHAGRYPEILRSLEGILGDGGTRALAHQNALDFLRRMEESGPAA